MLAQIVPKGLAIAQFDAGASARAATSADPSLPDCGDRNQEPPHHAIVRPRFTRARRRHFIGRAPLAGATADPVLTLQTFEPEEEALALADHPTYGLRAGVYTRDLSRALRVRRPIEAGTVWINHYGRSRDKILPTGGCKAWGLRKDLGREVYHANRRSTSVLIDIAREAA